MNKGSDGCIKLESFLDSLCKLEIVVCRGGIGLIYSIDVFEFGNMFKFDCFGVNDFVNFFLCFVIGFGVF